MLAEAETLGALGVEAGHCVHVVVRPPGAPPPPPPAAPRPADSAGSDAPTPQEAELSAAFGEPDLHALRLALEAQLQAELRALAAHRGGDAAGAPRRGIFSASRDGDTGDFALGLAFGLLLGFVAFMCLLEPTAPRKMKAGLFLGAPGRLRSVACPFELRLDACVASV